MLRKSRLSAAVAFALASAAVVATLFWPKRVKTSKTPEDQGHRLPYLARRRGRCHPGCLCHQSQDRTIRSADRGRLPETGLLQLLRRRIPSSGSSFQSQSTVGLRGLGSERTLVLLNGKRVAGSPTMGGTSINLNTIPMAAVERVEVNLDGGSAIYGSDAIGGVINVVLKEGYEGLTFQGRIGSPSENGGDEKSGSIVAGITGEKGSLMTVYEHDKKDIIYSRDRDYLAKQGNESPSVYGRNVEGITGLDGNGDPIWTYGPLAGSTNPDGTCKDPL